MPTLTTSRADRPQPYRSALQADPALVVGFDDKVYPVAIVATLANSLAREGITAAQALDGTHIRPHALRSYETRVSVNQIVHVLHNATKLSRDPHFGYHTGIRTHISNFGLYGFAVLSSTSFRQGIDFAVRYHQIVLPLLEMSFEEQQRRAIWTFRLIAHPGIDRAVARVLAELHLSAAISLHRDGMGPSFAPLEIHLPFDPPRDARTYEEMLGCRVAFGHIESRLIYDSTWLDRLASRGDALTHEEVAKLCDDLMQQLRLRAGIAGKVRELLLVGHLAPTSCAAVAKKLYMTERTLRRKLSEEQTSFRKLMHDLRMHMAVTYLRDTDLTIKEIAHSLGFSEDASFRHAFRRWTKAAPQEFRDRLSDRSRRRRRAA